jgi:undecaprenyl-diphosphatase
MMHRPRAKYRVPKRAIGAIAVGSAATFATLSTLVGKRRTSSFDGAVRKRVARRHNPFAKKVVTALGYSGKSWVHGPAAALVADYVKHRGSFEGSRAINLASTLSTTVSKTADWMLKHRSPPPGRHSPREQSFPSGHTLESAALSLTAAHVLSRESLLDPRIAFPIAISIPILEGAGRLYLDRHWATDVAAGLCAGVTIAALCVLGYELKS